jgi:subtilisin-like proprotein convertase family protein
VVGALAQAHGSAQASCTLMTNPKISITDSDTAGVSSTISPANCGHVQSTEHVAVYITAEHPSRGELKFTPTSPSGVASELTSKMVEATANYMEWKFMTVRNWGETGGAVTGGTAGGVWTLTAADLASGNAGTLVRWKLVIYGKCSDNVASCTVDATIPPCSFIQFSGIPRTLTNAMLMGVYEQQSGLLNGKPYYTVDRSDLSAYSLGQYWSIFGTEEGTAWYVGAIAGDSNVNGYTMDLSYFPQSIGAAWSLYDGGWVPSTVTTSCPHFCLALTMTNAGTNVYTAATATYELQMDAGTGRPQISEGRPVYYCAANGLYFYYLGDYYSLWVIGGGVGSVADIWGKSKDNAGLGQDVVADWKMYNSDSATYQWDYDVTMACDTTTTSVVTGHWFSNTSSALAQTIAPTPSPTPSPTASPTLTPTPAPSASPTLHPTPSPTPSPTNAPTVMDATNTLIVLAATPLDTSDPSAQTASLRSLIGQPDYSSATVTTALAQLSSWVADSATAAAVTADIATDYLVTLGSFISPASLALTTAGQALEARRGYLSDVAASFKSVRASLLTGLMASASAGDAATTVTDGSGVTVKMERKLGSAAKGATTTISSSTGSSQSTSFTLPAAMDDITDAETVTVVTWSSAATYDDGSRSPASEMVGMSVYDSSNVEKTVSGLSTSSPITITLGLPGVKSAGADHNYDCAYYNEATGAWATDGLSLSSTGDGSISCSSSHLTDFVLLATATSGANPLSEGYVQSVNIANCPNGCSGHGSCKGYGFCHCYTQPASSDPAWTEHDCSERSCPRGRAWVDYATSDNGNSIRRRLECSGRGHCDHKTGECKCFFGYDGRACNRAECPNQCSFRGRCVLQEQLAYEASKTYSTPWDAQMQMGCACDLGARGPDCSLEECPPTHDGTSNRGGSDLGRDCSGRGMCDYTTGTFTHLPPIRSTSRHNTHLSIQQPR